MSSLEEYASRFYHLRAYLEELPSRNISEPEFYEKLPTELKYRKKINVIYIIDGNDGIFAHVYRTAPHELTNYIVIQPTVPGETADELIDVVDELVAKTLDPEKTQYSSVDEMIKILDDILNKVVKIDQSLKPNEYKIIKKRGEISHVIVSSEIFNAIRHKIILEKVYLGVLEPLLRDPYIEDISCDGVGPIYICHKIFGTCKTSLEFKDIDELTRFIIKLSERTGRPVNLRRPIVDATLPDGSRINIVFSPDVSLRGPSFTIRKFSKIPLSITQIVKYNGLSALEAAYIWLLLEHNMSVWVCGETASGKTTLLNAIIPFIRFDYKIVTIEDTPELYVPHENWLREVTREGEGGEKVTLFDLLKAALRQRPNYIIVGEIRGAEAYVAFQAIQTGHPVLATFHAGSVEKLIQRLTSDPINVPKTFIDNLNATIITSAVRVPKLGTIERRVLSINEIVGYDPIEERLNYIAVFEWDSSRDEHVFRGIGSSYLLEQKIAIMRGFSGRMLKRIYEELEMRSYYLQLLIENGVLNYFDVWNSIKYAQIEGIDRAIEALESGVEVWRKV